MGLSEWLCEYLRLEIGEGLLKLTLINYLTLINQLLSANITVWSLSLTAYTCTPVIIEMGDPLW